MSTINTQALLDAVSELIQERESVLAGAVSELTARVAGLSAENAELRGRLDASAAAVAGELAALRAAPTEMLELKTDDGHLEDWKDLVLGTVDATVQQLKGEWADLRESVAEQVRKERDALSSQIQDADAGRAAEAQELEERLDTLEERVDGAASEDRVRDLGMFVDDLRAEWPAFQAAVTGLVKSEPAILAKQTADEHRALDHQVTILADRVDAAEGRLADAVKVDRVQDLEEVVKAISRDEQTLKLAIEGCVERRDELSDELTKTVAEITNKVDTIHSHFDATLKTVDALRVQVGDAVDTINRVPSDVLNLLLERQGEVEDWKRGGAGYRALATVRHCGALWQARIDTKTEPGTGESWVMLADGASGVSVSCDEGGNVVFTTKLASGAETSAAYKMPHVNPTGVFDDGRTYQRYDTVVQDGNVFWAMVNDPGKIGETKGNWLCLGYRGKAGKRGPTLDEVASNIRPQLVRELTSELPGLVSVAVEAMSEQ